MLGNTTLSSDDAPPIGTAVLNLAEQGCTGASGAVDSAADGPEFHVLTRPDTSSSSLRDVD